MPIAFTGTPIVYLTAAPRAGPTLIATATARGLYPGGVCSMSDLETINSPAVGTGEWDEERASPTFGPVAESRPILLVYPNGHRC